MRGPRRIGLLLTAIAIAAGDVVLWTYSMLACGVGENQQGPWAELCNQGHPEARIHAPLLGAALILASIGAAYAARRPWIVIAGASVGAGLGAVALASL